MTNTTCTDLHDELAELGFVPLHDIDPAERVFPAWVTNWRADNRLAAARTPSGLVVTLNQHDGDERHEFVVWTWSGCEHLRASFPMTALGTRCLLGAVAAAVAS